MSFRFNPLTGNLDLVGSGNEVVQFTKVAGENISALRVVRQSDKDTIVTADSSTYTNSVPLGVSISSGATGVDIEVIQRGQINDFFFNFALNEPLFLGSNGMITVTPPTSGFVTQIGHGLGAGAIYIDLQKPTELC